MAIDGVRECNAKTASYGKEYEIMKKITNSVLTLLIFAVCLSFIPVIAIANDVEEVYRRNLAIFEFNNSLTDKAVIEVYLKPGSNAQSDDASIITQAESITRGVSGDYEKAKAIHEWVAENIWYDRDKLYNRENRAISVISAVEVLKYRRSVCEGYTNLTVALLRASGIPAKHITGYAIGISGNSSTFYNTTSNATNHAWTEAYVNGRWIIIDTTWDSNNIYEYGEFGTQRSIDRDYFDISIRDFSSNHKYVFYVAEGASDVVIPENLITSIDDFEFRYSKGLKSIVIPDGVISIGNWAFENCTNLTSIVLPDSLGNIGENAFKSCSSLTNITIPSRVTSISRGAFSNCTSLANVVIQRGVTSIGNSAFYYCINLTSVVIPDGVTSIGDEAFRYCSKLANVVLPVGLKNIDDKAFFGCAITSIVIPKGVTSIGKEAFRDCSGLTSVVLPDGLQSIGYYAFGGCRKLREVNIPVSVTSIGEEAFDRFTQQIRDGSTPTSSPASTGMTATPTTSAVLVDNKNVTFDAYTIGGNNYFKLRDLANTMNGTGKQFEVSWDGANNAISLTSGQKYTAIGGEMAGKGVGNKTASPTKSKIYLDGKEVEFTAYNIGGNNYFKLHDIGKAFNFCVYWDGERKTIIIDTNKSYGETADLLW